MKENEIKVLLLRVVRTNKNNKARTLLQYATPDVKSDNYKGLMCLDQWVDGHNVFNSLDEKYMGIPLNATFEYVKTFKGQAKMVLKTIFEENGNCILAID